MAKYRGKCSPASSNLHPYKGGEKCGDGGNTHRVISLYCIHSKTPTWRQVFLSFLVSSNSYFDSLIKCGSEKKLSSSWWHWRTDDESETSMKKNTDPWWFEKQENILGAKRGSCRSKKMETTVYQSNIKKK